MNHFHSKRGFFTKFGLLMAIVFGLLVPASLVWADPDPPVPPPGVETYIPKPKKTPNTSSAQPDAAQADALTPPIGSKIHIPKLKRTPANGSVQPNATTALAWSVSLSTSNYAPQVNAPFTLVATANQDVGPTPYYIEIYLGSTSYASCGVGTTCSVTLIGPQVGPTYTFQARIAYSDGTSVQASSNTVSVHILATWVVSLYASTTNPDMNKPYTLTAYVNQDVGPTPFYLEIYWNNSGVRAICGAGTSCSVTLSWPWPQGVPYQARVSNYDGTNIQAQSNTVTVNVKIPSSFRLTPINIKAFQTQLGSAGDSSTGSLNCGPASAAMVINYWQGLPSGESATGQPYETARAAADYIRGGSQYNVPKNQYGTDFKGTSTLNLLSQFGLYTNRVVNSYDYVRQEIASGHPVIILVNNNKYSSLKPYPKLGSLVWTSSHIIIVTGYDTTNVYINDPLRQPTDTPQPQDFPVPVAMFRSAASTAVNGGVTLSEGNWYAMSVYK